MALRDIGRFRAFCGKGFVSAKSSGALACLLGEMVTSGRSEWWAAHALCSDADDDGAPKLWCPVSAVGPDGAPGCWPCEEKSAGDSEEAADAAGDAENAEAFEDGQ